MAKGRQPDLPAAPDPQDTYVYDDNGRLSYSVINQNGKQIYKPGPKSGAQIINEAALKQKQQSLLESIAKPPAEYTRAAQESADAYTESVMSGVNRDFDKTQNRETEMMNTRGLLGSKAWADRSAELGRAKLDTAAKVSQQATSMRDALVNERINRDIGLYNLYKGQSDTQFAQNMSVAGMASQNAANATNAALQRYQIQSQNEMSRWQAEMANDPWNKYVLPTMQTGGMVAGLMLSDRRLKKYITPLFKIHGVQFYSFEYSLSQWPEGALPPQPGVHIGVMADEVRDIPGAVEPEMFYGFDMVNYDVIRRHIGMENA